MLEEIGRRPASADGAAAALNGGGAKEGAPEPLDWEVRPHCPTLCPSLFCQGLQGCRVQ